MKLPAHISLYYYDVHQVRAWVWSTAGLEAGCDVSAMLHDSDDNDDDDGDDAVDDDNDDGWQWRARC